MLAATAWRTGSGSTNSSPTQLALSHRKTGKNSAATAAPKPWSRRSRFRSGWRPNHPSQHQTPSGRYLAHTTRSANNLIPDFLSHPKKGATDTPPQKSQIQMSVAAKGHRGRSFNPYQRRLHLHVAHPNRSLLSHSSFFRSLGSQLNKGLRGMSAIAEEIVPREKLGDRSLNFVANIMYLLFLIVVVPEAHYANQKHRGTLSSWGFIIQGSIPVEFKEASIYPNFVCLMYTRKIYFCMKIMSSLFSEQHTLICYIITES
jgi:hypothetical protein